MQDPTREERQDNQVTPDPHDGVTYSEDAIRVARPANLTEKQWSQLKAELRSGLDAISQEVMSDPSWCIVGERYPDEHEQHHCSATIRLDSYGAERNRWEAFVFEDRLGDDHRIKLSLYADGSDGVEQAEHVFPYELATVVLAATHTQESRDRLWALLEEASS